MNRWAIVLTTERVDSTFDGPVTRPVGYVDNVCLWDGVTPWAPPDGTRVVRSDVLEVGDVDDASDSDASG